MLGILVTVFFVILAQDARAVSNEFSLDINSDFLTYTDCKDCGGRTSSKINLKQKIIISHAFKCLAEVQSNHYSLYSHKVESNVTEMNPGDFFCSYKTSNFVFTLGYTSIEWSQNIGPQITDFFSAHDYRYTPFAGPRFRYSQPVLKIDYFSKFANLSLFASTKPHFNEYDLTSLYNLGFPIENEKQKAFQKFDYGLRLSQQLGAFDVSLSGLSLQDRDFQPFFDMAVSKIFLKHETFQSYGLGITSEFLGGILRLDYQAIQNRRMTYTNFNSLPVNENAFAVGIDSPTLLNTIFSIQYSKIAPVEKDLPLLIEPIKEFLILNANYSTSAKLSIEMTGLMNLKDQSKALKIDLAWPGNTSVDLHLGGESFSGEKNKSLDSYLDQTRVFLGVSAQISNP